MAKPMGGPYYENLKRIYRDETDVFEQLKPSRQDEQVCNELMKAMVAFKKVHPDRGLMQHYLRSAVSAPNETELCGVGRFFRCNMASRRPS